MAIQRDIILYLSLEWSITLYAHFLVYVHIYLQNSSDRVIIFTLDSQVVVDVFEMYSAQLNDGGSNRLTQPFSAPFASGP